MNISIEQFIYLMSAVLFVYVFFETKIYLILWIAILDLIIFVSRDLRFYKIIVTSYIILIFLSYIYRERNVLSGKEKVADSKFHVIQTMISKDKNKKRRISIVVLLFLVITTIAYIFFKKMSP